MQVLRANRATHAALGYRLHHGPGHVVHYGSAPTVTAVAPDSSRSFCLSREKLTLQQLNSRLAVYLQQVQFLEAANQQLECQIQKEMERKCPGELRQLDKHLRTVSLLQDQISECLSSQAQMKLELLSAELTVFDLNIRCEKERECCGRLDVEFSNLKQLGEELQVHRLPELQCQLDEQTQQLMEMETQHQEDMQVLLAQMSDVTVEMQPAESLDLIQQLDDLRRTSVTPLFNNQDECWFDTQGPVLSSPEVTTDSPLESEVMQTELLELRRRAMSLEEELTQLKAVNSMLEASGLEQHQSFIQQLVVLQQNADYLCGDLDSVLQATVQQAADCQILLDAKTRLEAEIEDYRRLLDGPSSHGLSSIHPSAVANVTAFCATTSPSAFSRDITLNQTVNVQEGSLRMMDVQAVSGGHIRTIGQTPVAAPLSETVTTVQPIRIHNTFPQSSPVTSIHTSNLMGLFKSESRRTGVLPERTGTESITISASINRQSSHVEEKVSAEDRDLQKSLIVSSQISQSLDDRAVVKDSKVETNNAQGVTTLVSDTQSARSTALQAAYKQTTTKAGLQANKTETNVQTEITKTILYKEPEVKQETQLVTHRIITDPSKERSVQAKNQNAAEVVSLETTEAVEEKVAVTPFVVSGSHILMSREAQVSGNLTLMDDQDIERQEKKEEKEIAEVEGSLRVLRLDQSSALSNASNSEQNKATENADTGSGIALVSSDNLESKTAQGIITLVPDTQSARIDAVQAKPESLTSKETTTETNIQTEITKTILCAEPEVKQETHLVTHTTTTESSQQTAAEVKKETESLITAQSSCTESSIQAENQGPAQVVSLSLEVQTEAIGDAGKVAVTSSVASRSHTLGSEEAQVKVSSDLSLKDDKDIERQEKEEEKEVVKVEGSLPVLRLHQTPALSDASNSQQNNVMEDANTVFGNAVASSGRPDSNDNLGSKTASTEILKKVEVEVNKGKGVNSFHDRTKEEGQSLSTSRDQAVPEKDRNDTNNSRPTSRGIGFQLSSLGGLEFRGQGHCSIIADKEMQLSFGGQYKEGNSGDRLGQDDQKEEKNSDQLVTNMPDNSKGVLNECVKSAKVGSVSAKEGTTSSSVASNSGALTNSSSGMASDLAAISGGMAPNSSCTVSSNVEECRRDIGQKMVDEGSLNVSDTRSKESPAGTTLPATSQQETGRFSKSGTGERIVHGGSLRRESSLDGSRSLPSTEKEEGPSMATNPATSLQGKGRFGSEDWIVYSGSLGRKKNLSRTRSVESQSAAMLPSTSMPEIRTCGSGERGDGMVYRGLKHTSGLADSDNLPNTESTESLPTIATSPQGTAKFGSRGSVGSGEWRVYGGSSGRMSSWAGSNSLPNLDKEESPSAVAQLPTSPPGSLRAGRFSSAGSAEWRVYGGSTGRLSSAGSADRVSISANHDQMTNPPSSQKSSGRRLSSASSGGKLSSGSVVKRSRSLGSGGNLSSSSSGGRLSNSSGSLRASTSVRYTSTGSGEWKPVYSSTSARKSSAGSTGRSGGGGRISSQKAPNPGGRMIVSMGSGGWLNSSTAGGVSIGSTGSGSKLNSTGGSDRISSRAGGRISSSSGSGRTNSTGGRVITSSDRPIRSTGSATGGNKERISVCKMAALSISAAGRERSQDRQRQQQQQQKGAATSPLLQRWLSAGVGVKTADPDDLDDVAPL